MDASHNASYITKIAETLLGRLDGVKRRNGYTIARCPAHDDRNPSLSIKQYDDGLGIKCHAGCDTDEILAAVDLTKRDILIRAELVENALPHKPREAREARVYEYQDAEGNPYTRVRRTASKRFIQQRWEGGEWVNGLNGTQPILYHLPDLMDPARKKAPAFVVEGEKDADRLAGLDLIATTAPMGAEKWRLEYALFLQDRTVYIIPDNDPPGRRHAEQIKATLPGAVILPLPGLPRGGDVSDWLDAGGSKERLLALAAEAEEHDSYDGFSTSTRIRERVPAFPVDALPRTCARYVEEVAASLVCPPELVGLPVLAGLSGVMGRSREIHIKPGWAETGSLYAGVVDAPGGRKSPAAGFAYRPVEKLQAMLRKEYAAERERYEKELRKHAAEKRLAAKEYRPEPKPPERPRMARVLVDDTTVERAAGLLEENPRGFLSAQDELTGFLRGLDQYKAGGKGNARQTYLKVYSSRPIIVDRKGTDEPLVVPHPYITLQGGIQPSVLHEIAGGRDDGFLDRFIFAYPEEHQGGFSDESVSAGTQAAYEDLIGKLWDQQPEEGEDGEIAPRTLRMEPAAKDMFREAANALAAERFRPGFPAVLRGPWSKFDTHLARLALIIGVARIAEAEDAVERITAEDMTNALRLLDYFKATTRKVYGQLFEASPDEVLAADLVTALTESGYKFFGTISDLHDSLTSSALPDSLEALGHAVRRIAQKSPDLTLETHRTGDSRMITLTLEQPSQPSPERGDQPCPKT